MSDAPFPFYVDIEVRFRDIDAMGHVNNAVYFTYLEMARSHFFRNFFEIESPFDFPVILGEASCRYLAPVRLGDGIRIGLGVSRFGVKSFDIDYRLETAPDRPVAMAKTTLVMYDYSQAASVPVPDRFKQQIRDFQGVWAPPSQG